MLNAGLMTLYKKVAVVDPEIKETCDRFVHTVFTPSFFQELQPLAPSLFGWLSSQTLRAQVIRFRDGLRHPTMPPSLLEAYLTFSLDHPLESFHVRRPAAWLSQTRLGTPKERANFLNLFYPSGSTLTDQHEKECVSFLLRMIPIEDLYSWQMPDKILLCDLSSEDLRKPDVLAVIHNDAVKFQALLFDKIPTLEGELSVDCASMVLRNYFYSSISLAIITCPFYTLSAPRACINLPEGDYQGRVTQHPGRNLADTLCPIETPSAIEISVYTRCILTLFRAALAAELVILDSFKFPFYPENSGEISLLDDQIVSQCPPDTRQTMKALLVERFPHGLPPTLAQDPSLTALLS